MDEDPAIKVSDPKISAWVAANAGAGKTYTLANRVTRLLMEPHTKPERILCLTFTKAAAAEMQDRLFRQLGDWAMLPDDALRAKISQIGGDASGPLSRARRLFASALETPGGLKILTLHAFCQIVLSRFPLEAGVPPAFEVLDEQSALEMIAEARQRILERAGRGELELSEPLAYLASEIGETSLKEILDSSLTTDRRKLDRFFLRAEDFVETVCKAHALTRQESESCIAEKFCEALRKDIERLRQARDWLAQGGLDEANHALRLSRFLDLNFSAEGFSHLGEMFLTGAGEPRRRIATKKLAERRPDLLAFLRDLQERYCEAHALQRTRRACRLAVSTLKIIAAIRKDYESAKRQRGYLDYDDLIVKTRDLLEEAGAASWVLYKLDGGIEHVLIDEAQDTSPEQWEIVRKLTQEFFAGIGREQKNPRTIFAVGDEKQSIFSFQGADPAHFAVNLEHFARAAKAADHPFLQEPLSTSRRSAPAILQFVDQVFASEEARSGLTFSGDPISHPPHRLQAKGGIEFWPCLKPRADDAVDLYKPVDGVQKDSPVARLAVQIADKIAYWTQGNVCLPGHSAPIKAGDIMVLLPRREPFGSEIIRQLKLRKIPVSGADRVRLNEQIAAMDLIALGRFVLQREDDLNLAALLRSPLCALSEEELYCLAYQREADIWRSLVEHGRQSASFARAHDFLKQMLERADYAPPFEFYSHALIALGGQEKLLGRLGSESLDAIEEFLNLSLGYEQSHSPSLEGFLHWVENGGTEIKRDMERARNEVRVMTVHGAKGLEADIVILPDTASLPAGLKRRDGLLYFGEDVFFPLPNTHAPQIVKQAKAACEAELLKEHRRLFYVALTRARDRLCICGFEGKKGVKENSWYPLAQAAARRLDLDLTRKDDEVRRIGSVEDVSIAAPAVDVVENGIPHWAMRKACAEHLEDNPLSPSQTAAKPARSFATDGDGGRYRRGTLIHYLLARLPQIARQSRHAIASRYLRSNGVSLGDADLILERLLRIFDDPLFACAFGPQSKAEVGIIAARKDLGLKTPITGRIDRLSVEEDKVLVIDYKTDRKVPDGLGEVRPEYLAQMALYRAALEELFPKKNIVCGLVFTAAPCLLHLPDSVLNLQLRQTLAALQKLDPEHARS